MTTIANITRRAALVLALAAVAAPPASAVTTAGGGVWKTTNGGKTWSATASLSLDGGTQVAQTREHILLARQGI